jgi:hypothetical protein
MFVLGVGRRQLYLQNILDPSLVIPLIILKLSQTNFLYLCSDREAVRLYHLVQDSYTLVVQHKHSPVKYQHLDVTA